MTDQKKEDQPSPATKKSRRHFTVEQRIALLDEADKPGQSIAIVARKHGCRLSRNSTAAFSC